MSQFAIPAIAAACKHTRACFIRETLKTTSWDSVIGTQGTPKQLRQPAVNDLDATLALAMLWGVGLFFLYFEN
jgi:hypothetical protein